MKRRLEFFLSVGVLLLTVGIVAGSAATGSARARLVRAAITVDEKVVLEASTSDDGHPDADEVWNYLIDDLVFLPTDDFASLKIDPTTEKTTIGWLKGRSNEAKGEPPVIRLDVAYGGRDKPYRLGLVRAPSGEAWRVDPETVERRFSHRSITRFQAAQLEDPKRKK